MVYKKYAKKTYTKAKPKVAKATKKYVKTMLDHGREDKYFDLSQVIASGTVATNTAGSVVCMSAIAGGTAFNQRVGELVNPKSLEIRFDATSIQQTGNPPTVTDTNLRVIIFQDHQIKSSTVPTVVDLLETVVYNSPINHIGINAKRWHIIMDKIFELDPNCANATNGQGNIYTNQTAQAMHKKFKLRGRMTFTNATTGADLNNVYVLYISDQTNSPSVNLYSRLIFEDA